RRGCGCGGGLGGRGGCCRCRLRFGGRGCLGRRFSRCFDGGCRCFSCRCRCFSSRCRCGGCFGGGCFGGGCRCRASAHLREHGLQRLEQVRRRRRSALLEDGELLQASPGHGVDAVGEVVGVDVRQAPRGRGRRRGSGWCRSRR